MNALVDGELAPAERAAAADRLADDREFARAHATLMRLKASVMEAADEVASVELPAARRCNPRLAMLAGSAALAAAIAAVAVVSVVTKQTPIEQPVSQAELLQSNVVLAAFPQSPFLPDLASAGLKLVETTMRKGIDAPVLTATYLGPRGCRLELRVQLADAAAPLVAGSKRHAWRVGDLAYELVAYGMPADRFAAVAEAAERATRSGTMPRGAERRLQEASASAPPCLA